MLPEDFAARLAVPTRTGRSGKARAGAIVAGGAGFLGSHLCDRLIAEGFRVFCLDNFITGRVENVAHLLEDPAFILVEHDVRAPVPVFAGITEIYHLACPASPPHYQRHPIETAMTSAEGTLALLTLARQTGARFLLSSTSEVYGDPEVHPQPEHYRGHVNPTGPRACYDEGKRLAESLCYDFVRLYGLDVRVARIFNTYGPRMRLDDGRIVTNFIGQALAGQPMTVYGSGEQTRSFCYVADMIEGLVRLMRHPPPVGSPVNLGAAEEVPVIEVARRIARLVGTEATIEHRPLPVDDPHRRRPDISLARRLLGWRPRIGFEDGLRRTLAHFAAEADPAAGATGAAQPVRSEARRQVEAESPPA